MPDRAEQRRRQRAAARHADDPKLVAAIDLLGRTGAADVQIRYSDDEDPNGHGRYWAPVTPVTPVTIPGQGTDADVTAVSPPPLATIRRTPCRVCSTMCVTADATGPVHPLCLDDGQG